MGYSIALKSMPSTEAGTYIYTVTRTDVAAAATAQWAAMASDPSTSNNRAANALDFAGGSFPSGSVSFAAGQASADFSFSTAADGVDEFWGQIFNVGIVGSTAVVEARIYDDDDAPAARSDDSPQLQLDASVQTWVSTSDQDTYRMTLEAGKTYKITSANVEGFDVNFGHFDVTDAWGSKIVSHADSDGTATFTAATSGMYFVTLASDYNHGGYEVSLTSAGTIVSGSSIVLTAGIDSVLLTGLANISADGNAFDNVLSGNQGNNRLSGGAGNDTLRGGAGNDTLDGGSGIDVAVFSGSRASYTVANTFSGWSIGSGADGTDALANVERGSFSDTLVALDIAGNAGQVARILGAVFGAASLANKEYVGTGLWCLDNGMSYEDLCALAVRAAGKSAHADVVDLLWNNIVGSPIPQSEKDFYVGLLDGGMTVGALTALAANTAANSENVDLVGLAHTGIAYQLV